MEDRRTPLPAVEALLLEWLALTPPAVLRRLTEILSTWDDPVRRTAALRLMEDALSRSDAILLREILSDDQRRRH